MLFASITSQDALANIPDAVDGVELRLDHNPDLIASKGRKLLLTLRSVAQGGKFAGDRERGLGKLLEQNPDYLDVEYDVSPTFIEKALKSRSKIILSYHNFECTPDLESIYMKMSKYPAHTYKIAAKALSSLDSLRMLSFAKAHSDVSVICMGEDGQFARILGPTVQNIVNFSSVGYPAALGQLSADELLSIYRFDRISPKTAIYGLIGDPVSQSLGHIYHNEGFKNRDAVYVKIRVEEHELVEFFKRIKEFNFRGLSVTMPLKEKVLPFLDKIDPRAAAIGAVNTLLIENGEITGTNTDGIGAMEVLGSVENKHLVILGSGGAARAIAYEAKSRGAIVTILSRNPKKAGSIAHTFVGSLSDVPAGYDILINCTPVMPISASSILKSATVMDLSYNPSDTVFIKAAKERGCKVVSGLQMFRAQAKAQAALYA